MDGDSQEAPDDQCLRLRRLLLDDNDSLTGHDGSAQSPLESEHDFKGRCESPDSAPIRHGSPLNYAKCPPPTASGSDDSTPNDESTRAPMRSDKTRSKSEDRFAGMKWVATLWGLRAHWTVTPDEKMIQGTVKHALGLSGVPSIEFLAEGAFNKIYVVTYDGTEAIIRVSLPILPELKTESEVATIAWVRRHTSMPVPKVLAFQSDRQNPIGFEWIIMERVKGKVLEGAWKEMSFSVKESLVRQMAQFCSELFDHPMDSIGSLYGTCLSGTPSVRMGPSTSLGFVTRNPKSTPHRGPFTSPREWIAARLDAAENDTRYRLKLAQELEALSTTAHHGEEEDGILNATNFSTSDSEDNDDADDEGFDEETENLETSLKIIKKLRAQLPNIISAEPEPFVFVHDDLNQRNMLVDDEGQLTGIVDWECVSTYPISLACDFPCFLLGEAVTTKPVKGDYAVSKDGEVNIKYWNDLEGWELHRLRELFLVEMRRLQPGWDELHELSQRQRDFFLATLCYDDPWVSGSLLEWLRLVECDAPDVPRLWDM